RPGRSGRNRFRAPAGRGHHPRRRAAQVERRDGGASRTGDGQGHPWEVDGRAVVVGSADLLDHDPDRSRILELNAAGKTAMFVGVDGRAVGIVAVADTIRDDAYPAISALHDNGVKVIMATGDARRVAETVAAKLG